MSESVKGRRSSVLRWMAREIARGEKVDDKYQEMIALLNLAADELDRDPTAPTAGKVFELAVSLGGEELQAAIASGVVSRGVLV